MSNLSDIKRIVVGKQVDLIARFNEKDIHYLYNVKDSGVSKRKIAVISKSKDLSTVPIEGVTIDYMDNIGRFVPPDSLTLI